MKKDRKDGYLGGLAILAAVSCLCLRGLKKADARLKKKSKK